MKSEYVQLDANLGQCTVKRTRAVLGSKTQGEQTKKPRTFHVCPQATLNTTEVSGDLLTVQIGKGLVQQHTLAFGNNC